MPDPHDYSISDLAYLLPAMDERSFSDLVKSIRAQGLLEPVSVWHGQIVDGRHRYRACREAGVEPNFDYLADETDPIAFVLAKNLDRRHLSTSQKAVAAYRLSVLSLEHLCSEDQACAKLHIRVTQQQAADRFGVSRRSLNHARAVLAPDSPAVPELRQAVEHGLVTVSDAAKIVGEPPDVQSAAVDRVVKGTAKNIGSAAKRIAAEDARSTSGIPDSGSVDACVHPPVLHECAVGDLAKLVPADSVDAIITHPPLTETSMALYSDLADFAVHALKVTGVLVVMVDGILLLRIMDQLKRRGLGWVVEMDYQSGRPQRIVHPRHRLTLYRRPILVYGKSRFRLSGSDIIRPPSAGDHADETGPLKGFDAAMVSLVARFTQPGQMVCDPFILGRGGTAVGALDNGCRFIGADPSGPAMDRTKKILAQAGYAGDRRHDTLPE